MRIGPCYIALFGRFRSLLGPYGWVIGLFVRAYRQVACIYVGLAHSTCARFLIFPSFQLVCIRVSSVAAQILLDFINF